MFFSVAGSGVLMYTQILIFLLIELAVEDSFLVSMTVLTDPHSTPGGTSSCLPFSIV